MAKTPQTSLSISPNAERPLRHDPVCYWRQLCPGAAVLPGPERLQERTKSAVYRLPQAGPNGETIIAKWCDRSTARLERFIYEELLPAMKVASLRCYGALEEPDGLSAWVFLEDAGLGTYSPANPEHRALAGRWLAHLHLAKVCETLAACLPARDARYYFDLLRRVRERLRQLATHPCLPPAVVLALRSLARLCDQLEACWPEVEARCAGAPRVLVHGDLVLKNVRLRRDDGRLELLVFDWENAGWGIPAVDLTGFSVRAANPDLSVYWAGFARKEARADCAALQAWVSCGRLFRLLDSIQWSTQLPPFDSYFVVERSMACLQVYGARLAAALRAFPSGRIHS